MATKKIRINHINSLLTKNKIKTSPIPVDLIAKNLDVEIVYEITEDSLSGFLFKEEENQRTIIGVNASHHPNRQRFTIAHEIGHLLLHNIEGFHFDEINFRNSKSSQGRDKKEIDANRFAAELLMPEKFIERDMKKIKTVDLLHGNHLPSLAKQYQVSVRAMTIRLANLDYINL